MSDSYSILRIKRKRTAPTQLDALVIDAAPPFKRRRNVQPDTPAPPSENRGIFRFAETVSLDSFDTDNKTRQLRDRITAFLAHPPPALSRVSSSSHLATPTPPPSSPSRKLPASLRAARLAASTSTDGSTSPKERSRDERVSGYLAQAKRARYRIVERGRESWGGGLQEARPPEVVSAAEFKDREPEVRLKIYDAVEEEVQSMSSSINLIPSSSAEDADIMDNFVPMLKEYLTLQDSIAPSSSLHPPLSPGPSAAASPEPEADTDEEFVYDVYYRDLRQDPASLLAAQNDVGSGAGLRRIGELAGLEDDEILTEEISSEEEDEYDQDSNEENDYRNDYPDGESEDSEDEDRWEG